MDEVKGFGAVCEFGGGPRWGAAVASSQRHTAGVTPHAAGTRGRGGGGGDAGGVETGVRRTVLERAREERRNVELGELAPSERPHEAIIRQTDHRRLPVLLHLRLSRGLMDRRRPARRARIRLGEHGLQGACAGEDPARSVAREVVERAGEDFGYAELKGEVDREDGVGVGVAGCVAAVGIRRCCFSSVPVCERGGPVVGEPRETLDAQELDKVFRG